MSDFTIQSLAPEEWEAYRAIRLEALQDAPQAFASTYAEMVQRRAEFWQARLASAAGKAAEGQDNWLLFARAEEGLIGLVGAYLREDGHTAEVISVYVRPAWRGRGVGRALLEAILDLLRRSPAIHTAALTVNVQQEAAVKLYRALGFAVVNQVDATLGDGRVYPEYWMEKRL